MRKLSSKKKLKKVKGKDEEEPSQQESGDESFEANNENGGKKDEAASGSESGSKSEKRKTKKSSKAKDDSDGENDSDGDEDAEKNEENGDEEEYEVQDIVDEKVEKGETFYLIRWKGWGPDGDTWEPEDTLSCPDIVEKFKKKKQKGKKPTATPKKPAAKGAPKSKATKRKATEDPPTDPDKEWEVERIIDVGYEKGARLFRVRWKGYRPKFDTWEPEEHLNCSDLVEKFMKKIENNADKKRELREIPKKTQRFGGDSYRRGSKRNAGKTRTVYYEEDE